MGSSMRESEDEIVCPEEHHDGIKGSVRAATARRDDYESELFPVSAPRGAACRGPAKLRVRRWQAQALNHYPDLAENSLELKRADSRLDGRAMNAPRRICSQRAELPTPQPRNPVGAADAETTKESCDAGWFGGLCAPPGRARAPTRFQFYTDDPDSSRGSAR